MPPRRRQNLASCRVLADGHALPTGRLRRLRCSMQLSNSRNSPRDAAMRDEQHAHAGGRVGGRGCRLEAAHGLGFCNCQKCY